MDDVLFENRYTEDKQIVREFHRYVLCNRHRQVGIVFLIIGLLCATVLLMKQLGVMNVTGVKVTILWEASIIFIFLGFMLNIYFLMTTKIALGQDRKAMGGEIPETVIQFSEDDVVISELGKIKTFHYRELGSMKETKNLFCLPISRYAAIVAVKDCFSYGNPDDFRTFIEGKFDPTHGM